MLLIFFGFLCVCFCRIHNTQHMKFKKYSIESYQMRDQQNKNRKLLLFFYVFIICYNFLMYLHFHHLSHQINKYARCIAGFCFSWFNISLSRYRSFILSYITFIWIVAVFPFHISPHQYNSHNTIFFNSMHSFNKLYSQFKL